MRVEVKLWEQVLFFSQRNGKLIQHLFKKVILFCKIMALTLIVLKYLQTFFKDDKTTFKTPSTLKKLVNVNIFAEGLLRNTVHYHIKQTVKLI
jgi:hypothetical protein